MLELTVVLAVIGVLAAIALPSYHEAKTRAVVAAARQNLSALANASQVFAFDTGRFPQSLAYDSIEDLTPLTQGCTYLSSVQYPDPFQRPNAADRLETEYSFGLGSGSSSRKHGFVYVNYQDFLPDSIPQFNGIGIYSLGPDRRDSLLSLFPLPPNTQQMIRRSLLRIYGEGALQPIVIYCPTNGIHSGGDFGAFRGRFCGLVPRDL